MLNAVAIVPPFQLPFLGPTSLSYSTSSVLLILLNNDVHLKALGRHSLSLICNVEPIKV